MPNWVPKHESGAYPFRHKWFGVVSLLAMMFSQFPTASSAKTVYAPPITVNGAQVALGSLERDDSVFVPVRGFFEKLGASVSSSGSTIVATRGGKTLARMTLGSRSASFNGSAQTLAVAPFKSGGSVMLPLRALSEAAGATVSYEADPRAVKVTSASYGAADATVAQASPMATDAAVAPVADTQTNQSGIPWWVWLLLAILVIGLIFYFMSRRKKEPIIITRK